MTLTAVSSRSRAAWPFALALAVALPFGSPRAHASIAGMACMKDERLPDRVKAAQVIVVATPKSVTAEDKGDERRITARYEVTRSVKGAKKIGEDVSIVVVCRRNRLWSDDRGYPSSFCGFEQNQVVPGFQGARPLPDARRTLVLEERDGVFSLVRESMMGPCPKVNVADRAKKDAALRGYLDAREAAPEWKDESALPFSETTAVQANERIPAGR